MLYPIMTESRLLCDLSGIWKFKLDQGAGFEETWYRAPLTDAETMPVPASYNDLQEGREFRDHYGWVFYQRCFSLPESVRQERVVLRMEAVTHTARVYLNGRLVCEHKGGFLPFEAEIGELLENGENLLTIAVSNRIDYTTLPVGGKADMLGGLIGEKPQDVGEELRQNHPNFDFFNYAGITRPVKLYTTPRTYLEDISVVTKKVWEGDAPEEANRKRFWGEERQQGASTRNALLEYEILTVGEADCQVQLLDAGGRELSCCAMEQEPEKYEENGIRKMRFRGSILVEQVILWEPLQSYLYQLRVTFGSDVYQLPYGIRTVRVEGNRFLINEKPFYFKGYGKHEDTFPNGRGQNLPMNKKDLSLMKWQGANSFRTSHYPYSEEMLRQCDEEGIVVIDETPAVGINLQFGGGANFGGERIQTFDPEHGVQTFEHHREVIRDMIARDKNYACVVLWSIANEPDSAAEGAYEYFRPLFDLARRLDPQERPCTLVSVQNAGGPASDCSARLSDVICLNRYYGWYFGGPDLEHPAKALRAELKEWEALQKPVLFTEYGADTVMGFHDTTPVMYTEEYQVEYYRMNHRIFDEFPCVAGEQVWNFADFATSQSLLRVQGNKKGIFTRDRKPKLAAHELRERWKQIPDFGYQEKKELVHQEKQA